MKNIGILLLSMFCAFNCYSQKLTGEELLAKSIAYHDPTGAWKKFKGMLTIVMQRPNGDERISEITMDFAQQYFNSTVYQNGDTIVKNLDNKTCLLLLNGSKNFDEETQKRYRLDCENASKMKNYYSYLYGLPMKLKDPGTLIDPIIKSTTFDGKKALVLKVNYTESVGKDTWYFYFNPVTYALQAYQFYHDESKNDGEYILLNGEASVNGIKMPKNRAWYYNKDDVHLGTDMLK